MPCTSSSTNRAGHLWVKPGHDEFGHFFISALVLGKASLPVFFVPAPGAPVSSVVFLTPASRVERSPRAMRKMRERSAARRHLLSSRLAARRVSCETRARLAAHRCGDFAPWDRTSGPGRGALPHLIPQAFARVRPVRVQPSKAAPRSWSGRLPKASRTRGHEPRRASAASCPAFATSRDDALKRTGRCG
jgi:hypothetical protein